MLTDYTNVYSMHWAHLQSKRFGCYHTVIFNSRNWSVCQRICQCQSKPSKEKVKWYSKNSTRSFCFQTYFCSSLTPTCTSFFFIFCSCKKLLHFPLCVAWWDNNVQQQHKSSWFSVHAFWDYFIQFITLQTQNQLSVSVDLQQNCWHCLLRHWAVIVIKYICVFSSFFCPISLINRVCSLTLFNLPLH